MRCNPERLGLFLSDDLEVEDQLEFLCHLHECGGVLGISL